MKNRSRLFKVTAVLGGCLVVLACVATLGFAGFYILSQGNPLDAFSPSVSNRIVYVGNDSNIYVVDPTGTQKTQLTKDGDGGTARGYDFPTWAPDGRHLAFVGVDFANGNAKNATLYSADATGQRQIKLFSADQFFPFYLYWSPDGHYLTFLASKGSSQLSLELAPGDKENSSEEIQTGSPLYFAWSPDSRKVLMHVGGTRSDSSDARLALLALAQKESAQSLSTSPGAFQAPQWSPDGQHLLFSRADGDQKQVVEVANAQGDDPKALFDYQGRISFSWSPAGDRIAYIATPPDISLPTFGNLQVIDVNGTNPRDISGEHTLAFFWSPNGKRIAYLTVRLAPGSSGSRLNGVAQTQNNLQVQWKVKDLETDKTVTAADFVPTDDFVSTLPFFDQYARSVTFWSPDSQYLVYASGQTKGQATIWIADALGSTTPRQVGEGVIAFWSWK